MKTTIRILVACLVLGLGPGGTGGQVQAASSYDGCVGTVSSLPATIGTQGTWCLKADLGTALASGAAITITVSNVTLDCNSFKLGGLNAGDATATRGVLATGVDNVRVRDCNIRGFRYGVQGEGDGFVIENNRFEGNTQRGISLSGSGNTVRGNQVRDTGGSTIGTGTAFGILLMGDGDIIDNSIADVFARAGSGQGAWGMNVGDDTAPAMVHIEGNRVRGIVRDGAATSAAIRSTSTGRVTVRGNALFGVGNGYGLQCGNLLGVVRDNAVIGFGTGLFNCPSDGGNTVKP